MPRKISAFACEWNCGRNVLTSRVRMALHESRCNWNPANHACITCANFSPSTDGYEPGDCKPSGCDAGEDVTKLRNHCDKWANPYVERVPNKREVEAAYPKIIAALTFEQCEALGSQIEIVENFIYSW